MPWPSRFEDLELHGRWWEPGHEEMDVGGIVSYDSEKGIRLRITGRFPGEEQEELGPDQLIPRYEPEIVVGNTEKDPATLKGIHLLQSQGPGYPLEDTHIERTYWVETLVLGGRLSAEDLEEMASAYFSFTNFEEWLGLSPYEHSWGRDEDDFDQRVEWHSREEERFSVGDIGAEIHLDHMWGGWSAPNFRDVELTSRALLGVHPEEPQSLQYFRNVASKVADLLGLLIDAPVFVDHVSVPPIIEDGDILRDDLAVFWAPGRSSPPRQVQGYTMPYNLNSGTLRDPDFEECIRRWFSLLEWGEDAADLFSTVQRRRDHLLKVQILLLTQAAESFHRGRDGGFYMDPDEYADVEEELTSSIPDCISPNHRDALGNRIHYGYQYSLRKRLRELIDELAVPDVEGLVGDIDNFIDEIVRTRNYFTHYDEEIDRLEGPELAEATANLERLLQSLFLGELGIDHIHIRAWLQRYA